VRCSCQIVFFASLSPKLLKGSLSFSHVSLLDAAARLVRLPFAIIFALAKMLLVPALSATLTPMFHMDLPVSAEPRFFSVSPIEPADVSTH